MRRLEDVTYEESLHFCVCVSNCSLSLPEEALEAAQREILSKIFSTQSVLKQLHMHGGVSARSIHS